MSHPVPFRRPARTCSPFRRARLRGPRRRAAINRGPHHQQRLGQPGRLYPVFRTIGADPSAITIVVFAAGVAAYCLIGSWLGSHKGHRDDRTVGGTGSSPRYSSASVPSSCSDPACSPRSSEHLRPSQPKIAYRALPLILDSPVDPVVRSRAAKGSGTGGRWVAEGLGKPGFRSPLW